MNDTNETIETIETIEVNNGDGNNQPSEDTLDYSDAGNVGKVLRSSARKAADGVLSWIDVSHHLVRFAAAGAITSKDSKNLLQEYRTVFSKRLNGTVYASAEDSNSEASNASKLAAVIKLGCCGDIGVDIFDRTVDILKELRGAGIDTISPFPAVLAVARKQTHKDYGPARPLSDAEIRELVCPADKEPKTEEQLLNALIKQTQAAVKKIEKAGNTPARHYQIALDQYQDRLATVVRDRELMEARNLMAKHGAI
jgi:hypothetical protein